MKPYRRYGLFLLTFFLCQSLVVGLFNVAVDPYEAIGSPKIMGFNQVKPEIETHSRLFKAIAITRIKVKTLILGSSRTELGLDPTHVVFANSQPGYNLALSGPNMYEVMRYFQHAIENQPELKTVVLGIDFFMFNEFRKNRPDFTEDRLNSSSLTLQEALAVSFSLDALDSSQKTIRANRKSPQYSFYDSQGMRNINYQIHYNLPDKSIVKGFKFSLKEYLRDSELYKNYKLSEDYLNALKTLIIMAQEKNIEVKVFISPSHVSQWEAIRIAGLWPIFENWKREVVKITPVWDFSGYNSITIEAISNDMKNYVDSSHYRKEIGDLVLQRMFHYQEEIVPEDFGFLMTSKNIEEHLQAIRNRRKLWAKMNNKSIQFVQKIADKLK